MSSPSSVPNGSSAIPQKLSKRVAGFSIVLSVLLIVCRFLAILLPIEMSLGVVIVVSWLMLFSGGGQLVHVFSCQGIGDGTWKALIAALYLGTGFYLGLNPGLGIAALTLTLVAFFVAQGLQPLALASLRRRDYAHPRLDDLATLAEQFAQGNRDIGRN